MNSTPLWPALTEKDAGDRPHPCPSMMMNGMEAMDRPSHGRGTPVARMRKTDD